MKQIHKLDEPTRSLMRSSFILTDLNSIVDELIANSLDAKATKIIITIDLDTCSLTIEDNGDGITYKNMSQIAERHHSSKTSGNMQAMRGITSLGYKGEALAALSQVSMLQITSKNKFDDTICSKLIRGGTVISLQNNITDIHQEHGTVISVKDIFYNLKIRRRAIFGDIAIKNRHKSASNPTFKKTVGKLTSNLVKWCVAHYDIQFVLNECTKRKLNKIICKSKGYSSPKFVLSSMIDPDLIKYLFSFDSDDMLESMKKNNRANNVFECDDKDIRIRGILCDVRRLYHTKKWQFVFLNKRCVRHKVIYKHIIGFLMKMHKCFKSDNDDYEMDFSNISVNERELQSRVPWYSHKKNKHHQYPIFAVFIETDAQNIIVLYHICVCMYVECCLCVLIKDGE